MVTESIGVSKALSNVRLTVHTAPANERMLQPSEQPRPFPDRAGFSALSPQFELARTKKEKQWI